MTSPLSGELLPPYQHLIDGHLEATTAQATLIDNPIGVGAVGGSGTRLIAAMLTHAGVAMATPINKAGDALEWPPYRELLSDALTERFSRDTIMANTHRVFESLLENRRRQLGLNGRAGWKVPGTFHWIEDLAGYFPRMQYVHLMRSGLDMAYSTNQTQATNWSKTVGVELTHNKQGKVTPGAVMDYWLTANELAIARCEQYLPGRAYTLRFEQLCASPREEVTALMQFLELDVSSADLDNMAVMVKPPASVDRFRHANWRDDFSAEQLSRLSRLGYQP